MPGNKTSGTPGSHKSATIQDVARHANVSPATVSRVVNGATSVDRALAERVRLAIKELRYQPNRAARMLAGRRSATVGLLVTDIQNPFFMEIIRGVEHEVQRNGYLLALCNSAEDPRKERQYLEVLLGEPVAGAIIVPAQEQQPFLKLFAERRIPVVAVDRRVRDPAVDAVLIDNVSAAREAVAHLIANGYRRIGLITGPSVSTTGNERLIGYRQALSDAGLTADPALERRGPYDEESGSRLASELLDVGPPVDAIFACNNRLTVGVLGALTARTLRISDDIGLVGFDELSWAAPIGVSITAVHQPAYELGTTAAARLMQRLQRPDVLTRQEIVLGHELRVRNSSRPRLRAETEAETELVSLGSTAAGLSND
ncbi:MAG: LacI family DNA-binding transcriptional regulator [Thermomicrobiales bacterium]